MRFTKTHNWETMRYSKTNKNKITFGINDRSPKFYHYAIVSLRQLGTTCHIGCTSQSAAKVPEMSNNMKNRRRAISLETKIKILDRLEKGQGSTAVGKEFGLGESTIRVIGKNKDAIRNSVIAGTNVSAKKTSYSRGTIKEKMEKALVIWIEDLAQKRIPIDGNLIKQRALRIYKNIKVLESSNSLYQHNNLEFSASTGWLTGFLKRYGLYNLGIKGDVTPVDEETANNFLEIIEESRDCPDQIFNAEKDSETKEERTPITTNLIQKGLQLASELENYFLENDIDLERALKFQRELRCCISGYRELYKELVKPTSQALALPSRSDVLTISSDDDSDLTPVEN